MNRQIDPKIVEVGGRKFSIYPFGAFYCANLSGELTRFFGPFIGGAAPILQALMSEDKQDTNIAELMPGLTSALENMDGNKVEYLLAKLLIAQNNIYFEGQDDFGNKQIKALTKDVADGLFVQEIQDMYILAFEVIRLNFGGFFGKLLGQYGLQDLVGKILTTATTETSTSVSSST